MDFICSHCNYSLTIKKTSNDDTKIIEIKKPENFIEFYNKKDDKQQYKLDIKFELSELETFINQSKNIKKSDISDILQFYTYNFRKNISKYNLVCSTCGSDFMLKPETTIYTFNNKKQQTSFNDDIKELAELKLYDPTLPRTKDYICIYPNCESNQHNFDTSKKEAIFYRASGSFHMKYACLVCKGKSWRI